MFKSIFRHIAIAGIFFGLVLSAIPISFVSAQSTGQQLAREQRAKLETELAALEAEIKQKQNELNGQRGQSASIQRDINILTTKIQKTQLDIKAKNIVIQKLGDEIQTKNRTIQSLSQKIEKQRESLAQLIRKTNELDRASVVSLVLSSATLSEFYSDVESFESIKAAVRDNVDQIQSTKKENETQKEALKQKQNEETDARVALETNRRAIQRNETEQKSLLSVSKNKEQEYQKILNDRARRASQIRSALFSLRDTGAIPFGDAYNFALEVEKRTGVRPAFLLAILTQESNLGQNVGQCLVTDFITGDGVGRNTGRPFAGIMKPDRDIAPFLDIANRLGFDPKTRPVSCPQPGGYGGAMGPSQFIPSTWAGLERRIAAASGSRVPNPWVASDAFFASGVYLADLGAAKGGYSAEFEAAARYYAGSRWQTRGGEYARSVARHAQNIQENMIDPLQNL
ncbi:MAG: lytic murein transglycosylase [Candidatus Pacebacteria bacterium]|jgi:peptidoglycan hydrolase CwlO-like protein|nr:lytic murein transglycosylase [Candidatus Paceibacterota bacterium]